MKNENQIVIKCPKCGREFLPCEIYLPDSFLGKSRVVVRSPQGKVEYISGTNMDLQEEYLCDCGTHFKVEASVEFKTSVLKSQTQEEYITQL